MSLTTAWEFLSPDDGDDAGNWSHVQLKSTADALPASKTTADCKTYRLRLIDERLRKSVLVPRLLVVLEDPDDAAKWLTCNADYLA
jgi:hypothetical protein